MPPGDGLHYEITGDPSDAIAAANEARAAVAAAANDMERQDAQVKVTMATKQFSAAKKKIDAELRQLSKDKADVPIGMDTSVFNARAAQLVAEKKALSKAINIPVHMDRSALQTARKALAGLNSDLDDHESHLGAWFRSLSKVRIQVGFLSGTLRQFALGFGLLAPIIFQVAGALSALVGVIGTGLTGALAVGVGAMGGFALSALGMGMVMKPLISQFTKASAASTAYNDAVLKYGKSSTQAKDKLDQLNQTLKGVSPGARAAIKDWGGLKTQWDKLTAPARRPFFDTVAEGIRTAKALLPDFAHQTVATMKVAGEGVQKWFRSLRSPEAREAINQMMSGFRESLPSLMDGLGSIVAMLGRVGASASKFLPGLTGGFAEWANSLEESIGSGAELDSKIGRLIGHLQDLGHFTQATGRLMVNFFGLGADAGDDMLKSITASFNRWSDWMNTAGGKKSMRNFFSDSADAAGELVSAFAHIGKILFNFGRIMAPFSDFLLTASDAAAGLVDALMSLAPTRGILQGIGAALATLWIAGKIATGVRALAASFLFLRTAASGAGLMGALSAFTAAKGGGGPMIFGGPGAIGATSGKLATLGGGMLRFVPIVGAVSLAVYGAYKAFNSLTDSWDELGRSQQRNMATTRTAGRELGNSVQELGKRRAHTADATRSLAEAQSRLNALEAKGKEGTPAWIQAQQAVAQAVEARNHAENKQIGVWARIKGNMNEHHAAAQRALDDARRSLNMAKESAHFDARTGRTIGSQDSKQIAAAEDRLARARKNAFEMASRERLAELNIGRIQDHNRPIVDSMAVAYGRLAKTVGGAAARKLGNIIDPQKAQQAINLSNRLSRAGQGKVVKDIIVNSKGADETIRKLQQLQRIDAGAKTLAIKQEGAEGVLRSLARITGTKFRTLVQQVRENGVIPTLRQLQKVSGFNLGPLIQHVSADTSAWRAAVNALPTSLPTLTQGVRAVPIHGAIHGATGAAVDRRATGGRRVDRPTMITGEEGPTHSEWIVTENPAHRRNNVHFLNQAANALGFGLVPGFKQGKGAHVTKPSSAAAGSISSETAANQLAKAQAAKDRKAAKLKQGARAKDSKGGKKLTKEEKKHIQHAMGPGGKFESYGLHIARAKSNVRATKKWEADLVGMKDDISYWESLMDSAADEGSFNDARNHAGEAIKNVISTLQTAMRHASGNYWKSLRADLGSQLADQARVSKSTFDTGLGSSAQPFAAQVFTANQARYDLMKEFGSNLIGGLNLPSIAGGALGSMAPGSQAFFPGGSVASQTGIGSVGTALGGGYNQQGGGVTINNHFAGPPPDPHTWSQQQNFEMAALI